MAVIGAERFEELRLERLDELRRLRAEGVKVVGFFSHYVPDPGRTCCMGVWMRWYR
jgi:hypothetical protein